MEEDRRLSGCGRLDRLEVRKELVDTKFESSDTQLSESVMPMTSLHCKLEVLILTELSLLTSADTEAFLLETIPKFEACQ